MSRTLGDRDRAADIVQETYSKVFNMVRSKGHGADAAALVSEPRALLFRIAKNIAVDTFRRERVREASALDEIECLIPESSQPENLVDQQQQVRLLLIAIESLPERCKQAFILFKFEHLPQSEIAKRMGISQNMVEKHIIRGMLACKEAIERQVR